MSQVLSQVQAEELHKSIISYFSSQNQHDITSIIRDSLNLGSDVFPQESANKYEGLLVRKWTGLSRLLRKNLDLEARNAALELELKNVTPASRRYQDPASWLPTSPARYTLESHQKEVRCIAFHPVFSSLASGSEDCTIKIWDWQLGELEKTIKGHTKTVTDLDFGGARGKTILASCSSDLTIKLWDPANEYQNTRTLHGHDHSVTSVRFIPSGNQQSSSNLLASASRDSSIRIWDISSGYCVSTISGHTAWVKALSASSDGRFLFSTGGDKTCRLWDISTSKPECKLTMTGHENYNECCAIAPPTAYKYLAPLAGLKKAHPSSSTAEFMATGSRDKQIRLWDSRGICIKILIGHDNWVNDLVFHPCGRYLLSVSDDKTMRCWDLSQEGKCVKVLSDHGHFITSLKWAPSVANGGDGLLGEKDGKEGMDRQIRCVVATGCVDMKVRIFLP